MLREILVVGIVSFSLTAVSKLYLICLRIFSAVDDFFEIAKLRLLLGHE